MWISVVFPAHAGVFLRFDIGYNFVGCIPRSRGGVSIGMIRDTAGKRYSPLTRGCFSFRS